MKYNRASLKCVTEAFGAYFLTKQTAPAKIFRENLRSEKINSISFQNKKGGSVEKRVLGTYCVSEEIRKFWGFMSFGNWDQFIALGCKIILFFNNNYLN